MAKGLERGRGCDVRVISIKTGVLWRGGVLTKAMAWSARKKYYQHGHFISNPRREASNGFLTVVTIRFKLVCNVYLPT